ncbi:MAG: zinc ribbon domain-containing protein [Terriglobia bacterium]
MLPDLQRLIELQQVDLRLLELTHQIELFPQRRAETEQELARARESLARLRTHHTESLKARKKLELDVQQFEEKIRKHKEQIYQVKSNEAYRTLQQEIDLDQEQKARAEDRVLEAMIAAEELEKQIKAAEEELAGLEQRVAASLRRFDQEQTVREKEAAELTGQRDALRGQVAEETLTVYDRIAHAHAGQALAQARDEVCQVCLIHIRPQTYTEVKRNDQIHYCESCHRILYYVPAVPPGVQQPVPASS